jgi:hypothetical protein
MAERDENGRFIKGVSGNPKGRLPKDREERYMSIMLNTVTFSDWERIIEKAVEQAKRGDSVARKWLSDYLVGPPQQKVDVTTDGQPISIVRIGVDTEGV